MDDPVSIAILRLGDITLGWILQLPGDLPLVMIAMLTASALVVVRRWATNQDRLTRAREDQHCLKARLREAKRSGDRDLRSRLRSLQGRIGLLRLRAEGRALLWAIVPVAFLAAWAYERMPYLPPQIGEAVEVALVLPASHDGRLAHLIPSDHLSTEALLVRFQQDPDEIRSARAIWQVVPDSAQPLMVELIANDQRYQHELRPVHGLPPTQVIHSDGARTELQLRERRLLGIVPGWPEAMIPAWLVGYLIIVIALIPVTKRVLKLQ